MPEVVWDGAPVDPKSAHAEIVPDCWSGRRRILRDNGESPRLNGMREVWLHCSVSRSMEAAGSHKLDQFPAVHGRGRTAG